MEKIVITIDRLGMIRRSKIEISPVMIFSGESGLGKSYLAMLCHYFFEVLLDSDRFDHFIKEKGWSFSEMQPTLADNGIAISFSKEELEQWLAKDAIRYIGHMLNHDLLNAEIKVQLPSVVEDEILVSYEKDIDGFENSEEIYIKLSTLGLNYRIKEEVLGSESPFAFLLRFGLVKKIFGSFKALTDSYVFPPSRGPVLTEEVIPQTGLYEKFKNSLLKMGRIPSIPDNVNQDLVYLFKEVMEGYVSRKEGKYIYTTGDEELPISAAAASIREIASLAMLVERTDLSKVALLIEEPEAHLHPLKQRMMADIFSLMCKGGAFMQITTHSDYFLRRINELIGLYRLQSILEPSEFYTVCKELNISSLLTLDTARISGFLLEKSEDGSSIIEVQELSEGIPFESFSDAIDISLSTRFKINEYLDNNGGN